jgi:hypothetical protein
MTGTYHRTFVGLEITTSYVGDLDGVVSSDLMPMRFRMSPIPSNNSYMPTSCTSRIVRSSCARLAALCPGTRKLGLKRRCWQVGHALHRPPTVSNLSPFTKHRLVRPWAISPRKSIPAMHVMIAWKRHDFDFRHLQVVLTPAATLIIDRRAFGKRNDEDCFVGKHTEG